MLLDAVICFVVWICMLSGVARADIESACYGTDPQCDFTKISCPSNTDRILLKRTQYGYKDRGTCLSKPGVCRSPDGCCSYSAMDCAMDMTLEHTYDVYRNCSGKSKCGPFQSPWQMLRRCRDVASSKSLVVPSNYVAVEYECVPDRQVLGFCEDRELSGEEVNILYDGSEPIADKNVVVVGDTAEMCKCTVTSMGSTVSVGLVDVRLQTQGGRHADISECGADGLSVNGERLVNCHPRRTRSVNFIHRQVYDLDNDSGQLDISLDNLVNTGPTMAWITVKAESSSTVLVNCNRESNKPATNTPARSSSLGQDGVNHSNLVTKNDSTTPSLMSITPLVPGGSIGVTPDVLDSSTKPQGSEGKITTSKQNAETSDGTPPLHNYTLGSDSGTLSPLLTHETVTIHQGKLSIMNTVTENSVDKPTTVNNDIAEAEYAQPVTMSAVTMVTVTDNASSDTIHDTGEIDNTTGLHKEQTSLSLQEHNNKTSLKHTKSIIPAQTNATPAETFTSSMPATRPGITKEELASITATELAGTTSAETVTSNPLATEHLGTTTEEQSSTSTLATGHTGSTADEHTSTLATGFAGIITTETTTSFTFATGNPGTLIEHTSTLATGHPVTTPTEAVKSSTLVTDNPGTTAEALTRTLTIVYSGTTPEEHTSTTRQGHTTSTEQEHSGPVIEEYDNLAAHGIGTTITPTQDKFSPTSEYPTVNVWEHSSSPISEHNISSTKDHIMPATSTPTWTHLSTMSREQTSVEAKDFINIFTQNKTGTPKENTRSMKEAFVTNIQRQEPATTSTADHTSTPSPLYSTTQILQMYTNTLTMESNGNPTKGHTDTVAEENTSNTPPPQQHSTTKKVHASPRTHASSTNQIQDQYSETLTPEHTSTRPQEHPDTIKQDDHSTGQHDNTTTSVQEQPLTKERPNLDLSFESTTVPKSRTQNPSTIAANETNSTVKHDFSTEVIPEANDKATSPVGNDSTLAVESVTTLETTTQILTDEMTIGMTQVGHVGVTQPEGQVASVTNKTVSSVSPELETNVLNMQEITSAEANTSKLTSFSSTLPQAVGSNIQNNDDTTTGTMISVEPSTLDLTTVIPHLTSIELTGDQDKMKEDPITMGRFPVPPPVIVFSPNPIGIVQSESTNSTDDALAGAAEDESNTTYSDTIIPTTDSVVSTFTTEAFQGKETTSEKRAAVIIPEPVRSVSQGESTTAKPIHSMSPEAITAEPTNVPTDTTAVTGQPVSTASRTENGKGDLHVISTSSQKTTVPEETNSTLIHETTLMEVISRTVTPETRMPWNHIDSSTQLVTKKESNFISMEEPVLKEHLNTVSLNEVQSTQSTTKSMSTETLEAIRATESVGTTSQNFATVPISTASWDAGIPMVSVSTVAQEATISTKSTQSSSPSSLEVLKSTESMGTASKEAMESLEEFVTVEPVKTATTDVEQPQAITDVLSTTKERTTVSLVVEETTGRRRKNQRRRTTTPVRDDQMDMTTESGVDILMEEIPTQFTFPSEVDSGHPDTKTEGLVGVSNSSLDVAIAIPTVLGILLLVVVAVALWWRWRRTPDAQLVPPSDPKDDGNPDDAGQTGLPMTEATGVTVEEPGEATDNNRISGDGHDAPQIYADSGNAHRNDVSNPDSEHADESGQLGQIFNTSL